MEEEKKHLEKALKLNPNDVKSLIELGIINYKSGDLNSARENFEEALNLDSQNFDALINLAILERNEGNYVASIEKFLDAEKLFHDNFLIKYNLAYCYSKMGDSEKAKAKINEALKIKTDANASFLLGSILQDEKNFEQAKKVYEKALELDVANYKIHTNYGIVLHYLGEFEKAKKSFLKALELNPNYFDAKLNLAATLYQLQDYVNAEKIYEDLIDENPNDKILRLNYSVLLLKTGNFKRGLEEYENRLSDKQLSVLPSVPFWNGENLANKTLLVLDEQGAGDAIQFVRYLKLLKGKAARLILQTKKELASLFKKNNLADEVITSVSDLNEADYKIYLLSLPKILGRFPFNAGKYISPTQKATLPNDDLWKMKIGIAWRGNAENIYDKLRSIELNDFIRALEIPNAIFYSFQIDATADEKTVLKEKNIIDLSDKIRSFEDSANLLNEIDLLISVDTAIAHLAGAMGKKTFLLIGEQDWRWGINAGKTEWYDSVKLFRKKPEENFNRILETVKAEGESFSKKILNGKTLLLKLNAIEELNAGNARKAENLLRIYSEKTDDFEGYYWLGYIYFKRKKYDEAKRFYLEANKRNPQHEPTLSGLGNIALLENNFDDAAKYYSAAVKLKRDAETWNNFGFALYKLKKHKKAAEIFEEAIAIKKDPGFYVNAANNYFEMQEFDKALEYYNFAIQKGDLQGAHVGKGFLLLALGKFREGFREFVWSLDGVKVPKTLGKYWEGENLRGKTIVVYTEQGLGDAINFFRFVVPLKERGATVKVVCAKPLEKLFQTSPYVDEVKSHWFDEADYHISIMDLPRALGVVKEGDFAFPQDLFAFNEEKINLEKEKLNNGKLNIGLVWRTYSKAETAKERSINENEITKLLNLDANFYALQIDTPAEIKNSLEKEFPNLTFINENFYELAHTIKALDLIITIDTSVLHLAGSLGAKTFALIKKFPDWRWKFEGETSYVYPSIKIFRQQKYFTWHEPIDKIIEELENIMNPKNNLALDYHRDKSEILDLSEKFISKGKLAVALEILEEGIYFYPESEEILFKAGYISQTLGDFEKAVFYYGRLLAKNPAHINALNNIGVALKDLGKFNEAIKFLNLLIGTYPDFASAYNNLGLVYEELGEFRTAVQYYEKALRINPNFRDALLNKANSLMFLYEFDEAIKSVDKILQNNHMDVGANYNKGIIYLFKGDFENGFRYYEWRRKRSEYMRRSFTKPELNNFDISGKRILVYDEQGYGDSIQFCRFVKKLKELGAYVILQTHAGLQSLLSRCEGVDYAIVRDTLGDPKGVEYDYHIPLLSLPAFFGIKNVRDITNDSAYIKTNMNLKEKYRKEICNGNKPKVGLVWEGKKPKGNEHRSSSLEVYAKFIRKFDFDFYSLQQKNVAQKNKQLMNELGVVDLFDHLHNFDQTAAIIDNLDFVVTIDTSVAHLSGALNKKTFVLLSRKADWRWGTGERTPWYSSHILLRQKKLGDWSPVIETLINKINSFETDFKLIN